MFRPNKSFGWILLPAIIFAIGLALYASQASAKVRPASDGSLRSNQNQLIGVPAIPSSFGSIAKSDVLKYVQKHSMPHNLSARSHTVKTIELLTSGQLASLLHGHGEQTGLSDTSLVYYVELEGTFTFKTPGGNVVTFNNGYEVFDAQTGNLILFGGTP